MITQITTHTADALDRLPQQFKGKSNLEAFITAIVDPVQDLEDAFWQLLVERSIAVGIGAQLDQIGVIVGQTRQGLTDAVFRQYLRARVAANRSTGVDENLIRVAQLVLYDFDAAITLERQGPATVIVNITGAAVTDSTANTLLYFLTAAKAAGVRLIIEYGTVDPDLLFQADDGPGFDQGILATSI